MPIHRQRTFELEDASVGEALRAARFYRRLDQRPAAERAGLDWRVLSRIERGERPCRVTELVALSQAYDLRPDLVLRACLGEEKACRRLGMVFVEVDA